MLPNLKNALVLLYSTETFTSSDGKADFNRFSAFLGNINEVLLYALASKRR